MSIPGAEVVRGKLGTVSKMTVVATNLILT
jgi:hypothetical protein